MLVRIGQEVQEVSRRLDEGATRREALTRGAAGAAALAATSAFGGATANAARGAQRGSAGATAARKAPGYAVGFTSLTEEVRLPDVPVEGRLPSWLTGALLRNGPSLFEVGKEPFNHWFDGLAMLHAFTFARGRVGYANRFLRSGPYDAWKRDDRIEFSEFATDPCRSVFSGVSTLPIIAKVPNANVSLERIAGEFVAHTEVPIPVRFDPKSLRTMGIHAGLSGPGTLGTAHPHVDSSTGERFSYEVDLAPPTGYRVLVRGAHGTAPARTLATIPRAEPCYMHSFALTDHHVVLLEQPFIVDPAAFLRPDRKPIIGNYRWDSAQPARLIVIDRRVGGVTATVEIDPCFVFHHVNAFEANGKIEMDVCAYEDNGVIDALYLKNLRRSDRRLPKVELRRITLDPSAGKATVRALVEPDFELPRINYGARSRRSHRYAYGVGVRDIKATGFIDQILKVDVDKGSTKTWRERGTYPGEPVFVPRPGATHEDDGVVLSVVLDSRRGTSFLLVLDGRSFAERARAAVPHHIPFGFHGLHAPHGA